MHSNLQYLVKLKSFEKAGHLLFIAGERSPARSLRTPDPPEITPPPKPVDSPFCKETGSFKAVFHTSEHVKYERDYLSTGKPAEPQQSTVLITR